MKKNYCILFILFLLQFPVSMLEAQSVGTKNLGFENGNFDGWVGYQWRYSTASDATSINTSPSEVSLPTSRRHVIISDQSAYDSNTGNALKMIPEGYTYSARLGCEIKSSDSNPRCWEQSLKYTMEVDSSNAFLLMQFACVLEYSNKHDNVSEFEPRFKLTLYDEDGKEIDDCSNYEVYSSGNMEDEFNTYASGSNGNAVKWRDWTSVGADLSSYMGQEITIEFLSADCTGHYHFGYAYFVVDCMPLYITVDYCTGDSYATLEGPEGFEAYQWFDDDSVLVGSDQILEIESPNEGDTYYCVMQSETGCEVSLSSTVVRYEPEADFSTKMVDCASNKVMFYNHSETNHGTLSYLWDFGEDSTSVIAADSFLYQFETSGIHDVSLIIYNPPSGCTDTFITQVESFSPPLVGFSGDTTYCPGMETELTAFGAYSYEWSTGSTSETISLGAPGGDYWMLGFSTPEEGCVSDTTYFSISEEPDWLFSLIGDSILCNGDTDTLYATGAVTYSWNTGDTTDFISYTKGKTYSVAGANLRGCIKELEIDVQEVDKPDLDFSVSPSEINRRNNCVECSASSGDDVDYEWDMGDGTKSTSQQLIHNYSVTSELISYPVTITVTNDAGCYTSKSTVVSVEPFVPNVFTPNNDGINDVFMSGYDLKIFDRHGIVLYTGSDGWDGYYKGNVMDPDTYFYFLTYTDAYGQKQIKKGFITIEK